MPTNSPYALQRPLRLATSAAERMELLEDFVEGFNAIALDGSQDARSNMWSDVKASGLLNLMMDQLSQSWNTYPDDIETIGRYHELGFRILQGLFSLSNSDDIWVGLGIKPRLPILCRAAVETLKELAVFQGPEVLALQITTFMLLDQTYTVGQRSHKFLEVLDKDTILRLIFAILFEKHSLSDIDGCLALLSAPGTTEERSCRRAWLRAERQYDPTNVARKCANLWANTNLDKHYLTGLTNLMSIVQNGDRPVRCRYAFHECDVYVAILESFWRARKAQAARSDSKSGVADLRKAGQQLMFCLSSYLSRFEEKPEEEIKRLTETIKGLLEHDVILFLAHGFLEFSDDVGGAMDRLRKMWGIWIMLTCQQYPELMDAYCRPSLAQVSQSVESICRCAKGSGDGKNYDVAARQWRQFDQDIVRLVAQPPAAQSKRRGCSWIKCIMSTPPGAVGLERASDSLSTMLQCSECQRVQYCGAPCQKRDWVAGHQAQCRPSTRMVLRPS